MLWWIYYVVGPILGGTLAASGFVVARRPQAEQIIARIARFQGAIGVALLVVGLIAALDYLPHMGSMVRFSLLWGLVTLATVIALLALGILLGAGLLAQWLPGEGNLERRGLALQRRLLGIQAPLGLVAIGLGVAMVVFRLSVL